MAVRVCVLTTVHRPFDIRIFHKQAKALAKAGYDVTLIAQHEQDETVDGIKIIALARARSRFQRIIGLTWRTFLIARRQHADVYHFHDPELMPMGLLLKRFTGAKVIYDIHEDVSQQTYERDWIPRAFRGIVAWLLKHFERFSVKRFSAIVTADAELGERFRMVNRRTVVVQNFPMLEEFLAPVLPEFSQPTGKVVVDLGGISPLRSIYEIVQAMSLVPVRLGARLVLGGEADSEAWSEIVSGMPGWEHVENRGMMPRQEAMNVLGNAAAAIVLYSPAPNHLAVRSNRFFESLSAGVPVITSNFPRWREMVEGIGCGLTVDPQDPQAIADAIEYLITHPKEAAEMGQRGRQAVLDKYNWTIEQAKVVQLYDELLNGT